MNLERIHHLQCALNKSGGKHKIEEVIYDIQRGHAQLWETDNATVVTQVSDYGDFLSLNVWLAGGRLDSVLGLLEAAEDFARDNGCSRIEVTGRRGWKRVLEDHGFAEESVTLTKDL